MRCKLCTQKNVNVEKAKGDLNKCSILLHFLGLVKCWCSPGWFIGQSVKNQWVFFPEIKESYLKIQMKI